MDAMPSRLVKPARPALVLAALAAIAIIAEAYWLAQGRGASADAILRLAAMGVLLILPALLLAVRPDAWLRHRGLTGGVLVLAAGPLFVTIWHLLSRLLFPGFASNSQIAQFLSAALEIVSRLALLAGPILMARGLSAGLRPLGRLMLRPAALVLAFFATVTVALRLSGFMAHTGLAAPDEVAAGILGAVSALAWVPLAAVAASAVRTARPPRLAWALTLAATPLYILAERTLAGLVDPTMMAMGPAWLGQAMYLASALCLAAALAHPGWSDGSAEHQPQVMSAWPEHPKAPDVA